MHTRTYAYINALARFFGNLPGQGGKKTKQKPIRSAFAPGPAVNYNWIESRVVHHPIYD